MVRGFVRHANCSPALRLRVGGLRPPSRVEDEVAEVGRHEILTHCYWREAGPEFGDVNIMAVAHGTEKQRLLEHKAAIDVHLATSQGAAR